jgi:hypothetical protein
MEYIIVIFFLGLMVTLLVAKGLMMANDYAASEREENSAPPQTEKDGK